MSTYEWSNQQIINSLGIYIKKESTRVKSKFNHKEPYQLLSYAQISFCTYMDVLYLRSLFGKEKGGSAKRKWK
jgi:hypothetical protein